MLECKMEGEDPVLQGADGEEELLVVSPVPSSISWIIRVLRKGVGGLGSVVSCLMNFNFSGHKPYNSI